MNQSKKLPLPKELYVSPDIHRQNRQKLVSLLKTELQDKVNNGILILPGVASLPVDESDVEYQAQQESNFWYLFGVEEPDCFGIMETDTGRATVFIPKFDQDYKMWMYVPTLTEVKDKWQLDETLYVTDLEKYLETKQPSTIYLYDGINSDSKLRPKLPTFTFLNKYPINKEDLYEILDEARVIKSQEEIKIMKFVCMLASEAHEKVLQQIQPGNKEYQCEAIFKYHNLCTAGARFDPYNCICASSRNSATLHYIVNDREIKDDTFVLCDMGAKYYGYCSDITVTFPSNGVFNPKQKIIYNTVLAAQKAVFEACKPGVNWGDIHYLAEQVIVQHLKEAGLIHGELKELYENRIGQLFFPHGLGHLLGLRVHDVGGYNKKCPPRLQEIKSLRFRRNLEVGMILTNEPGCYFIEYILENAFNNPEKAKYLNKEKINEFMDVGGVRLEDDLVITENGAEVLNDVPREIEEVEACMRGEDWRLLKKK